jgi:hypothetical protein
VQVLVLFATSARSLALRVLQPAKLATLQSARVDSPGKCVEMVGLRTQYAG